MQRKEGKLMGTMDIYDFLNSRDVRQHLKGINYEFSTLEKAFIIYKSNHRSLKDKRAAWKELIDSTEDIILGEDGNKRWLRTDVYLYSVHDLIKRYIEELDTPMGLFLEQDEESVYIAEVVYAPTDRDINYNRQEAGVLFKDFASAEAYCKDWISDNKDNVYEYIIKKQWVAQFSKEQILSNSLILPRKEIAASYRKTEDGFSLIELVSFGLKSDDCIDIENEFFERMWFDIPIPFKKGDIVVGSDYNWGGTKEPFVLKGTVPWIKAEARDGRSREGCDSSDMNGWGWSGGFYDDIADLNDDVMADYLDLEYYRGDFTGKRRLLKLMAEAEKGNLDYWDIITWYQGIVNGETAADKVSKCYTEEYKKKALTVFSEGPLYEE